MKIALDTGEHWFDPNTSVVFEEATWWDGSNHVSKATGSQWDHQRLYYTSSANWVLHEWSQWEGVGDAYQQITDAEATKWLMVNRGFEQEGFDELPENVRSTVEQLMNEMEV